MSTRRDADVVRLEVRQKHSDLYGVLNGLAEPKKASANFSTSTGVISLDAALGGKLPSGAVEIFGESSSGKTTLLYDIIAAAQASGMLAALCQSEYLDIPYMRRFGVDLNSLSLITGNHGEDVLDGALHFLSRHKVPTLLALDSATSIRPKDDHPGNWMVMIDSFLSTVHDNLPAGSCVVMVNQVRVKRSIDPTKFFVDGTLTSTARKIMDLFSTRIELSRGVEQEGGYTMRVNVVANIMARPARILELPVVSGQGVDTMLDLLLFGLQLGVVERSGTWFKIDDKYRLGSGLREAARQLGEDREISSYLLDRVMVRA